MNSMGYDPIDARHLSLGEYFALFNVDLANHNYKTDLVTA